ncbi:hypothetical protein L2E82_02322 [Cichorium intybus]|uniref:Uncharacterized protein n=1 Tax=Cichorium intybus TaxID=13427 RepID=A0ACB9H243_CICIN|nr:hypothetical protein L2E82_02322 [Cichorium intybus]
MPKCDICQDTDGYFFCLEDRALLCRKCDVAIHTVNHHVSSHQRFLLTGVKVGLESMKSLPCEEIPDATQSLCLPSTVPKTTNTQSHKVLPGDFSPPKLSYGGGSSTESIQQWQFDEFFGSTDLNPMYNYTDNDSSKMGDSDCSTILRALEVELDADDCFGQVPDLSWAGPQICSPPTASGLGWPKQQRCHHQMNSTAAFVPDVCYNPMSDSLDSQQTLKRRRHF